MGVEAFLDRLRAAGMNVEIIGDGNNSEIVVDGIVVGTIREDRVILF